MPKILVPNLSGSEHFDPSLSPSKNGPVRTHQFLRKSTAFLKARIDMILMPFDQASVGKRQFFDPGMIRPSSRNIKRWRMIVHKYNVSKNDRTTHRQKKICTYAHRTPHIAHHTSHVRPKSALTKSALKWLLSTLTASKLVNVGNRTSVIHCCCALTNNSRARTYL